MYILIFIFGLIVGSFFNVLIFRLGQKEGILLGRSECRTCGQKLNWYDLFPVLSFIFLKGRCRYCSSRISFVYPVVELTTAISFLLLFLNRWSGIDALFFIDLILVSGLLVIIFFDFIHFIIPDVVLLPLIVLKLGHILYVQPSEIGLFLIWAFSYSLFFAIIYAVSKGKWMGFGDVKLVFLIGLVAGYPLGFWVIILSVWTAGIVGVVLMVSGKATGKTPLPFGSFLSAVLMIFIIFKYAIEAHPLFHRFF